MKRSLPIHVFLFAVFPVLFLYSNNIGDLSFSLTLLPTAIALSFAFVLLVAWGLILRDATKAGIVASLFLILFFSYGHAYDFMRGAQIGGFEIDRHSYLLPYWSVLFVYAVYVIMRTRRHLHGFANVLNIVALSLVVVSLANIVPYEVKRRIASQYVRSIEIESIDAADSGDTAIYPDIYYIVLDSYAGADILNDTYQCDNAEFVDYLTKKGFYIAARSRSNYAQTLLSLASSLNLRYIDDLIDPIDVESTDREPLMNLIRHNGLFRYLKQYGYQIVAIPSGYFGTEIRNADIYMARRWSWNEFQIVLMKTTPLRVVLGESYLRDYHRKKILRPFDCLTDIPQLDAPVFVFAHIVAPHPPFVFSGNGEEISIKGTPPGDYVENYREQLMYVNHRLEGTLDIILEKSVRPTVVILQSDHGPASKLDWDNPDESDVKERTSILNAYYLPKDGGDHLYDGVTPVNTFRIVLNYYFGTNYGLLDDKSYFSGLKYPYDFIDVTETMALTE